MASTHEGIAHLFRRPFGNSGVWSAVFVAVVALMRFGHLLRGAAGAMLALSSQVLALALVLLLVNPERRKELGMCKFAARWWIAAVGGGLLLGAGAALINRFVLPPSWDWIRAMDRTLLPEAWKRAVPFLAAEVGLALIGGVLTPLAEELFFRGLLWRVWREGMGGVAVLVLQALLFAFLHLAHTGVEVLPRFAVTPGLAANIFVSTFAGGVFFGVLRMRSGSVWPAVLAHAAVNLAAATL